MKDKNALLLPSGFYDLVAPDAQKESRAVGELLADFESFGYAQVAPPLVEFETTLLSGRGESLGAHTFRVMDPLSQTMMGLRSDITLQVARIARTRLGAEPRPLRLCYAGPILRLTPEALKNERQLTQAGIELIGSDSTNADSEIMIVAAHALTSLGVKDISIDINLPGLLGELCPEAKNNPALRTEIKNSVMRKDAASIAALPIANSKTLTALIDAGGPLDKGLALLSTLAIKDAGSIRDVAARVKQHCPQITLTLDPIEYRGFDYHQGISFSIFARGLGQEVGRGGRYTVEKDSATGFTFYVTHLLGLLAGGTEKKRILIANDISAADAQKLRAEGWITVYALTGDYNGEAKALGIGHMFEKGKAVKL